MKTIHHKSERGQAIILIAMTLVGLIGMIGMMTDAGLVFIQYARMKRAIDAAAIAAAQSFRENVTEDELRDAAREFLRLNQSDIIPESIAIEICARNEDGNPSNPEQAAADPVLCTAIPRKLVRVTATRHVEFGFLSVIGIKETNLTATSIGEAASVDLVLVMDTSASMANETAGLPNVVDPGDDPALCNVSFTCQPLESIKAVAADFIETLYFPYDRVAIIASTSQTAGGTRDPSVVLDLTPNETTVIDAIDDLRVFEPVQCVNLVNGTTPGPCRDAPGGNFIGMNCELCRTTGDYSSYPSSNLGGAMLLAGNRFGVEPIREDSLWVVIVLAGGPANASDATGDPNDAGNPLRFGFCPQNTLDQLPLCRDNEWPARPNGAPDPDTRHDLNDDEYDSDDYAYDQADFVAAAPSDTDPTDEDGQGAVVFTIGLGTFMQNATVGDPFDGEELLRYIAEQAGDDISPGVTLNHGSYAFAPNAAGLQIIFDQIADSIFTRISE